MALTFQPWSYWTISRSWGLRSSVSCRLNHPSARVRQRSGQLVGVGLRFIFHIDHSKVVYPGVPHPAYGSQKELSQFVAAIHARGMKVLMDMDWTGFSKDSDFYNYDGSSYPSEFGPLFQETIDPFMYEGHVSQSIDLGTDRPSATILSDIIYRYSWKFGFDGIYWRGLLCLRLNSTQCNEGDGTENVSNALFLKDVVNQMDTMNLWVE